MLDGPHPDDRAVPRTRLRLLVARGEFAEARADRALRDCAGVIAAAALPGFDAETARRNAARVMMQFEAERMLQADLPEAVGLDAHFDRYATRRLIASDVITEFRTSTPCLVVEGELCRWVLILVTELLHVLESCADEDLGCRVSVRVDHDPDTGLVVRLASLGGASRPVPGRSGAVAIGRVTKVMRMLGAIVQRIEGRDQVFILTFRGGLACPDA